MKTMTCDQLGGACDFAFQAETFEEIATMSKAHGAEMFQKGDMAHLTAMKKMQADMTTPDAMQDWMQSKKRLFDSLSEDV